MKRKSFIALIMGIITGVAVKRERQPTLQESIDEMKNNPPIEAEITCLWLMAGKKSLERMDNYEWYMNKNTKKKAY
jgi:uncharacterized protein YneF (UPF0154 family)